MGGNQSQQQQQDKKPRKRDIFRAMYTSKARQVGRTLSESMRLMHTSSDILTLLNQEDMNKYPVKLLQYVCTYLSIDEVVQLRLVSKKLKWIVEVSSHIYANQLSYMFLRKMNLQSFVEYGSDKRFLQIYFEQLLQLELSQDESWVRIYKKFKKSISTMNLFQDKMTKTYDVQFQLQDKIMFALSQPSYPIPVLTSDVLKSYTTSWFQLQLAQPHGHTEKYSQLDSVVQKLEDDCIATFSMSNMEQTQLLIELRWAIVDNYISDPSTLEGQVPALLKFTLQVLHFVYLRCLFSRNVLMVIKSNKNPTQLLNFYVLLWSSYMGSLMQLNRMFEQLIKSIDNVFNFFYKTDAPSLSLVAIMGRLWSQIVIKGAKANDSPDPLEEALIEAYQSVVFEKRRKILEFHTKDQMMVQNSKQALKPRIDGYFKHSAGAIDCLLCHFTSAALDVSIHEQSVHWIGHSKLKVGSFYGLILEKTVEISNNLYSEGSYLLSSDYEAYKGYVMADIKYLEEIINRWTIQVCIKPIGLSFLQEKVKINLRSLVLEEKEEDPVQFQNDMDIVLESQILPQQQQYSELQLRMEKEEDLLEIMIFQILKEEKIDCNTSQKQFQLVQSICDEGQQQPHSKFRTISQFSISTRASNISNPNSQLSQFMSSFRLSPEIKIAQQIQCRIQHSIWASRLKELQKLGIQNQIEIDKRNNVLEMRNVVKQIKIDIDDILNSTLEFCNVQSLTIVMEAFAQKEMDQLLQQTVPVVQFQEIRPHGNSLAESVIQQQVL